MLVVGGTGLIGRALAAALVAAGLRPLLVARRDVPAGVIRQGARLLRADRQQLPALIAAGAILGEGAGVVGVVDVLAEGPDEVAPLLAAVADRPCRFVAIGSAAVYGQATRGLRYDEATPPRPSTDAMRRKLALERLIAEEHQRGRGATILRIAYPYGPGHGPLTPLGRARDLFGRLDGDQPIDWVAPDAFAPMQPLWADDLARAIASLLLRHERPRPLYHAAGPEVVGWQEWLQQLARGRTLGDRLRLHAAADLQALNPSAWWIGSYLRNAPLLDDTLLRREVFACETRLAQAIPAWAAWCASGDP